MWVFFFFTLCFIQLPGYTTTTQISVLLSSCTCRHRLWDFHRFSFRQHLCTVFPFTKNRHRGLPLYCLLIWLSVWTLLIHRSYCRDRMLREAKSLLVNACLAHRRRTYKVDYIQKSRSSPGWWQVARALGAFSRAEHVAECWPRRRKLFDPEAPCHWAVGG